MELETYATLEEATEKVIVFILGYVEYNIDDYDIDAIADAVFGEYEDGCRLKVDADTFWDIVDANKL